MPIAAEAAELNIEGVSGYSSAGGEIQNIASFSDIHPTDWTYQALKSLHQRHGCKARMPKGVITRFEAALLLNSCLANVPDVNDQEQALIAEFDVELAQIQGREIEETDALLSGFNAGAFSSNTKIFGEANFIVGGKDFEDGCSGGCYEAFHSVYSYKLNTNTSFTGKDSLKATIEGGNGTTNSRLLTEGYVSGDDKLTISNLYYTRPFGDVLFAAGPKFEMDALVATTTSSYSDDGLFNGWWYGPNSYSNHPKSGYPGFALAYMDDSGFNAGLSYIAVGGADATKGIMTKEGHDITTLSIGYDADTWGGGVIYTTTDDPTGLFANIYATDGAAIAASDVGTPVFIGLGGYWNVTDKFDISVGIDWLDFDYSNYETITSWTLAADYDLGPGTISGGMHSLPGYDYTTGQHDDAGMAYELYYTYPISDNIDIKPMVMFHVLDNSGLTNWADETIMAVETTFKF